MATQYSFLSFPMFDCLLTDKGYATGQNYTMINNSQISALLRTVKTNMEI